MESDGRRAHNEEVEVAGTQGPGPGRACRQAGRQAGRQGEEEEAGGEPGPGPATPGAGQDLDQNQGK